MPEHITAALVRRLIDAQFPEWAQFPIDPVEQSGWDNRTFRLGETLSVRLPSAEPYAAQVAKEHRWLPYLAPHLPQPIPQPLAMGAPSADYPWRWSVYRWINGQQASAGRIKDLPAFATDLARFLVALQSIDPADGPPPGAHNFFRGWPVSTYDGETRAAIEALGSKIDGNAALKVWEQALDATWNGLSVWVHGDVSLGNLLVCNGQLSAVIDFGCCGVGDPACDLAIAWTFMETASRAAFFDALAVDGATIARGRGWALWKALITVARPDTAASTALASRLVIDAVLEDAGS